MIAISKLNGVINVSQETGPPLFPICLEVFLATQICTIPLTKML